jgi:hypothetical protein
MRDSQTSVFEDMTFGKSTESRRTTQRAKDTNNAMNSSLVVLCSLGVPGALGGSIFCSYAFTPFHACHCLND